jgi:hypothetical protein
VGRSNSPGSSSHPALPNQRREISQRIERNKKFYPIAVLCDSAYIIGLHTLVVFTIIIIIIIIIIFMNINSQPFFVLLDRYFPTALSGV